MKGEDMILKHMWPKNVIYESTTNESTTNISPKESTTATSVDEPTTPSTEMSTPTADSI